MEHPVVDVSDLSRSFGRKTALDGVSFRATAGLVHGLVGANGAGKTTLLKHLLGLLRAETGAVRVFGLDPVRDPVGVLRRVGYLSEERELPEWMRIDELMAYTRAFHPTWDTSYARELLDTFVGEIGHAAVERPGGGHGHDRPLPAHPADDRLQRPHGARLQLGPPEGEEHLAVAPLHQLDPQPVPGQHDLHLGGDLPQPVGGAQPRLDPGRRPALEPEAQERHRRPAAGTECLRSLGSTGAVRGRTRAVGTRHQYDRSAHSGPDGRPDQRYQET